MINIPKERRASTRLEKSIPLKICSDDFDIITETRNLSCAGAYCRINKHLDPMTRLKVHLLLPIKKRKKVITRNIACQGVVVRVEPQPGNDHFNIAIYFSDIEQKDRKTIAEYVDSMLACKKIS